MVEWTGGSADLRGLFFLLFLRFTSTVHYRLLQSTTTKHTRVALVCIPEVTDAGWGGGQDGEDR